MLRVMIVDDELDILYGLQMLLDWEALGYELSALCLDGFEALEMCRRTVPDIIVTDIKMSDMDGLTLTRHIVSAYPNTRIIILSSYSDFEYMKSAIDLHVSGYLLKPVDTGELEKALQKAAQEIFKSREAHKKIEYLEGLRESADRAMQLSIFTMLLSGDQAVLMEKGGDIVQRLSEYRFQLLLARKDKEELFGIDAEQKELLFKLLSIGIHNRCELLYSCFMEETAVFVIVLKQDEDAFLQELRDLCERSGNDSVSILLTETVVSLDKTHPTFVNAMQQLKKDMLLGHPWGVYRYSSGQTPCFEGRTPPINKSAGLFAELEQAILANDEREVDGVFSRALKMLRDHKQSIAEEDARILFDRLGMHASAILQQKCNADDEIIDSLTMTLLMARQVRLLEDAAACITDQIMDAMQQSDQYVLLKMAGSLRHIVQYLQDNFAQTLSLEGVAKEFHMNPSYLSRVFRKNMDTTFWAFVTKLRMEHACKLLVNTDLPIKEIAAACGYMNEASFYGLFKKHMCSSPNEYRKMHSD